MLELPRSFFGSFAPTRPQPTRLGSPVIQRLEIRQDDREEFEAAVATIRALAAKEAPAWAEFVKSGPVSICGAELVVKS